ncbi:MAG: phosphopentomutase [Cyanobacteria bacterium REEB65]|nr:phosphopentomutase [Cyanobacteria bacterium REEB65]
MVLRPISACWKGSRVLGRTFILVLDGVGAGELPDAPLFGDTGSNTLGNTARQVGGLRLPTLGKLGLGNITPVVGVPPTDSPLGSWGKAAERSPGKDTQTGHWEMAGLPLDFAFRTFPEGFPSEVIEAFCRATGRGVLCNKPASGTEVITRYGQEHRRTGDWIVYTSGDSVFQIAAHEDVVPLDELYEACRKAREILSGPYTVGRVIARPFIGEDGAYVRDQGARHDYSVLPPGQTLLDYAGRAGHRVIGVGKIHDIFAGVGVMESIHTANNAEGMASTLQLAREAPPGALVFTNLVDTDSMYGHRNDAPGMARALEEFDSQLAQLLPALHEDDLLIVTADHGNDPTDVSTDHTREYIPILTYQPQRPGRPIGTREGFGDIAATIAEGWELTANLVGKSFWPLATSPQFVNT